MATLKKTLRADTHSSANNRPEYQDKPRRRPLVQGILNSSDNLRPVGRTRNLTHEWETDNTRTRQTVRLQITSTQSASKIYQKCFNCSKEIFDLTTAYAGRCCRKQYMCRRCFSHTDDAHYNNFITFRCCNQIISKQAFQISDPSSEMEPIPPICDSCDRNTETDFILPCHHKICSDCFEKEIFVRSAENHHTNQFFIGCSKHGSSKRLFAMQRVHKISFGKQSQYQGLACVGCAERLEGDCFEMECKHYVCNNCCKYRCYCSICKKMSETNKWKIVKIAGIQQHDLLDKQVALEPECMETSQTLHYSKCNSHSKICVRITCGASLCIECIETMAGGELVLVVTGKSDDKEHCICFCSPIRGKHIISITSLKMAAFQTVHVKEWKYHKCAHTTCRGETIVIFCECRHAFCMNCVHNGPRCLTAGNEKIYGYGNLSLRTCGIIGCNVRIPVEQLNQLIDKYFTDTTTTKRKCDTTKQSVSSSSSVSKTTHDATLYEGDPLKKVTEMKSIERNDDGKCSIRYCRSKSFIKLNKCAHRICKRCLLRKLDQGSKDLVPTFENKKDIREVLICGIYDCKKMYPVDHFNEFLQDTKRKRTSIEDESASPGSPIRREILITSPETPVIPKEGFNPPDDTLMTSLSSDVCSGTQDLENLRTKTEEGASKENRILKTEVPSRKKQSSAETLENRQTNSMSSSTSVMEEKYANMLEKTFNKPVDTAPSTTASYIYHETEGSDTSPTKKNPLSYIKEKTSAGYCSNTTCCSKAVVEFRKCSHRMCMNCVKTKISSGKTIICETEIKYRYHCDTKIPTIVVEEYLQNYVKNNMKRTSAENKKEVCDNPNCSAEISMKKEICETLPCKHKLCVICVSAQTAKGNVIRCKVPTCTPLEIKPEILGIPNIGFTCYASCVLQVLGQTPGFKDILSKYCLNSEENHMETLLRKLLENVNIGEERNYFLNWSLMEKLMARIFRIDDSFRRFQENDCHSFIMSLLNSLMKEETKEKKHTENVEKTIGCGPDSDEAAMTKNKTADKMDGCRSKEVAAPQCKKEKSSCPATLFESRLTSLFTYNDCSHEENVDDQLFYSLLIPVREDVQSLEKGLDSFFTREEFTDSALPCRECNVPKENTITTRSLQMSEAPKILMLQLARFEEVPKDGCNKELRKTNHPVKFKMTLRVKGDYTKDKKELQYELFGVIIHTGSMHGGHYSSYVRKQNTSRWFYCSDSTVCEVEEGRIFQEWTLKNAYVLFYSRKT